jgi:DNA polymerase-3 subunit delta
MEEELQRIKDNLGDASLMSTNTNVLEGRKLTPDDLKAVGQAMPFLAEKRLVIIQGLLERFEPQDKASRAKKTGNSTKGNDAQLLADCIAGFPDSTVVVMVDVLEMKKNTLKNNPLYQALSARGKEKIFPLLKDIKLSQWVQARVTQSGGSISRQATNILMEAIGSDLFTMSNEINKLVAYTSGRMIEEKDVRAIVSASREADIFAMVDAVVDKKAGEAEQILQKLLQRGTAAQVILTLIARQIQLMVQIKDLKAQRRPTSEIQSRLGLYPSLWMKISGRSDRYSLDRLKEIYQSLLNTDLAVKTGRFDGDLALSILVADLCR